MIHVAWPVAGLTWFVFQSERMWDAAMVLPAARSQGRRSTWRPHERRPALARDRGADPVRRFFVLLVLRVPVAFALGLACLPVLLFETALSHA